MTGWCKLSVALLPIAFRQQAASLLLTRADQWGHFMDCSCWGGVGILTILGGSTVAVGGMTCRNWHNSHAMDSQHLHDLAVLQLCAAGAAHDSLPRLAQHAGSDQVHDTREQSQSHLGCGQVPARLRQGGRSLLSTQASPRSSRPGRPPAPPARPRGAPTVGPPTASPPPPARPPRRPRPRLRPAWPAPGLARPASTHPLRLRHSQFTITRPSIDENQAARQKLGGPGGRAPPRGAARRRARLRNYK